MNYKKTKDSRIAEAEKRLHKKHLEIDKVLTVFDERHRTEHREYTTRNQAIKHLSSKGFRYTDIARYFLISAERVRHIVNDLQACSFCKRVIKIGDSASHNKDCKHYKK